MPYIEDYLRRKVDPTLTIMYASDEVTTELLGNQVELIRVLNKLTPDEYDGTLNYVCTQLIRHMSDKLIAESLIFSILNDAFLAFPKYRKLKDCFGLLYAMKEEFQRRDWNDFGIIKKMIQQTNTVAKKYEKAAQEKNSDLE